MVYKQYLVFKFKPNSQHQSFYYYYKSFIIKIKMILVSFFAQYALW